MPPTKRRAKGAGRIRLLPSGRYQARIQGPDGVLRSAPVTFEDKGTARMWLASQMEAIDGGYWKEPEKASAVGPVRLGTYAEEWLIGREIQPRTRGQYRALLDQMILPDLGDLELAKIKPTTVRNWHTALDSSKPTWRAHAYSLLRAIFTTAVADELIASNPCKVAGAGSSKKKHETKIASLPELEIIVTALPERYRAMALLAAWCGLRQGELFELRRSDITVDAEAGTGSVRVDRGVVRVKGATIVGGPKSQAGRRRVSLPPHLVPMIAAHLDNHTDAAADALLFPARQGGHMAPATLYRVWYPAREKAGRADLRFHDLRHTGATLAAQSGATLAELMGRLGHTTPAAAMIYQHVAADRDALLAAKMSKLVLAAGLEPNSSE